MLSVRERGSIWLAYAGGVVATASAIVHAGGYPGWATGIAAIVATFLVIVGLRRSRTELATD